MGKGEIARYEIARYSVFKRFVSRGRQKASLCGNGLILCKTIATSYDSEVKSLKKKKKIVRKKKKKKEKIVRKKKKKKAQNQHFLLFQACFRPYKGQKLSL